ncbi:MAG: hypothetical protein ABJB32_01505 [Verrucomicrobiota bacterium]
MKTKNQLLKLCSALAALLALAACETTSKTNPNAQCRAGGRGPGASYDMCSALNFTDIDGASNFDESLKLKSPFTAGIQLNNKWRNGSQLRVYFMNDPYNLKPDVLSLANAWHTRAGANLSFVEGTAEANDIRVSFIASGYWSVLGTQANRVFGSQPTMSLSFLSRPNSTELRRVVLHEFGHAIALIHEHQQPLSSIKWDRAACYRYFGGPPNCWPPAKVDANVLNREPPGNLDVTQFDEDSIMEYPVDPSLTIDHHGIGWNTDFSTTDKRFIAAQYPLN